MMVLAHGWYRVFWKAATSQTSPSWRRTVVFVDRRSPDGTVRLFCRRMMIPARCTTIAVTGSGKVHGAFDDGEPGALHDAVEQGPVARGDLGSTGHDGAVERHVGRVRRVQGGVGVGVPGPPLSLQPGQCVQDAGVCGGGRSARVTWLGAPA
jgi:hypothetical protein